MSILAVNGTTEYWVNIRPATIYIKTNDDLATVMTTGYLNGETSLTYSNDLLAVVEVTEGLVSLQVSIVDENTSLIAPVSA